MILAWLLLLTGLTISAVAIYYSVVGLTAIFSAAVIPIVIMGSALEVGKLVCASWLKANWERAPRFIKYYMITAVLVLMLITSMGIFGFLSKAHNDQNLVSGDVQSRLMLIEEKIKIERENIASSQQVIKQMDAAVNGVISTGDQEIKLRDGSTQIKSAAERSLQIRRSQSKDRAKLTAEIDTAQKNIIKLQEEAAPIRAENRKVEAEVGPIKYIAQFIYGDTGAETNMLEKAVTWVIILIVVVFDPLAVIMLLGAQMTFGWMREQKTQEEYPTIADLDHEVGEKPTEEEKADNLFPTYEEITPPEEPKEPAPHHPDTHPYLRAGFGKSFENLKPMVAKPTTIITPEPIVIQRPEIKVEAVVEYVPAPTADSTAHTVDDTVPTYQILPELDEESKKKTYMIKDHGKQITKEK
jgi:hypothetical protein